MRDDLSHECSDFEEKRLISALSALRDRAAILNLEDVIIALDRAVLAARSESQRH